MLRAAPLLAGVTMVLAIHQTALGADAPPPIRQFDISMIEKLGRAIYHQDQEAWKATDMLRAKLSDAQLRSDKLHGWIVDSFPDRDVVRFVHDGPNGPEAYYDVIFPKNGAAAELSPANGALTSDESAQYSARDLALKNSELNCSDTYNTVILKDPERDGWLVWVMAATKDPDLIIIGRHYRFTVSADGKTVRRKDALSASCLRFSRKAQSGSTGMLMNHVVSTTPVETHVFASLSYKMGLYVGTPDGRAWNVGEGRITPIDQDAAGTDGFAARALAGSEEKCFALVTASHDPTDKPITIPIASVIASTENHSKFEPDLPADDKASAITCVREDILPAPNDYKVLLAGLPLYIADKGSGHPERMGALEVSGGQLRFRTIQGPTLGPDLAERVGKRIDALQVSFDQAWQQQGRSRIDRRQFPFGRVHGRVEFTCLIC